MSAETDSGMSDGISARVGSDRKRKVKMRAAELGYETVTDYLIDLLDDDLSESEAVSA